MAYSNLFLLFSRGLSAALATTDTCAICAQESQDSGALGTGNARTASRAVESADAWRVSTAPPVKCVKWADMELTANQVTLMAIAACCYHPACKGRKWPRLSSREGSWEGSNVPRPLRQGKSWQATERRTVGVSTCGQPEWPHFSSSNQGMTDCAMLLILLLPKLQKVEVGGLFLGFWAR